MEFDDLKVALHIFLAVLILGTGWRLATYHLLASGNPQLKRLGTGMAIQY